MAENFTSNQNWFSLNDNGIVTVLESGLYMIYAQVITGVCTAQANVLFDYESRPYVFLLFLSFFSSARYLRGLSADRRETLPHDRKWVQF